LSEQQIIEVQQSELMDTYESALLAGGCDRDLGIRKDTLLDIERGPQETKGKERVRIVAPNTSESAEGVEINLLILPDDDGGIECELFLQQHRFPDVGACQDPVFELGADLRNKIYPFIHDPALRQDSLEEVVHGE
jgi:hypothetical protein